MGQENPPAVMLKASEAILAVADVAATVRFYRDVLGFEGEWLWGEPPTFGAVRWGSVQVMLCQQPGLAARVEGHQHFFRCDEIDALHARHQALGAPIIEAMENKPWGFREYVVRDINGYHLRFAGPEKYQRPRTARSSLPGYIRLEQRLPTVEESVALTKAVGWNRTVEILRVSLKNSLYGVVAIDGRDPHNQRIVGSIRVIGDGGTFFYIQDVAVLPEFQNQRIGSAMMELTMAWLKTAAPKGAWIGLFTGKPGFYERHGFKSGNGMSLQA
jgi:catechol 2,3-dioxygenase-like lactoylglutathione lyase family enzyme